MSESRRVVVVGGGVVGLCSAWELLNRGFEVTVLERDAAPGNGCSYGNGGLIVPSHFEPLAAPGMIQMGLRMLPNPQSPFGMVGLTNIDVLTWVARFMMSANQKNVDRCAPLILEMNLASRLIYEQTYSDIGKAAGYEHRGELMICRTQAALDSERRLSERAQKRGLKTRVLSKADLKAEEPEIEIDAEGAVYFEDDAKLTPAVFMAGLRKKLKAKGANIVDGVGVTGFCTEGRSLKSVNVGDKEFETDCVVIAAGSWSGSVAKTIGLKLPVLAGKGYGFTVPKPPQSPRLPALLIEGRLAVTPMVDGLRFVGTMELGISSEKTVNVARVEGMRRSISEYYPAFRSLDLTQLGVWCGLRPCTPDGMPFVGRSAKFDNLIIATGHGMMGMSLGPITGQLVGEVAAGETPSISLDLLSPDRYA